MTARDPQSPRCGRRVGYTLTDTALAAVGPSTAAQDGEPPAGYVLTLAGFYALEAWPTNRIEHEPRTTGRQPCDGRGCRCTFPGPRRKDSTP